VQLYFIRHGQSANNALWADTGSSTGRNCDPELTPVGWEQARRLADLLRPAPDQAGLPAAQDEQNVGGFRITHLYCSLMVRSVATGAIVAEALSLPLLGWVDLHETGGIYLDDRESGERVGQPGKSRAYFQAHYPSLVLPAGVSEDGWWNRAFEEHEERPVRAQRALRELLERHGDSDDRVAWISHGGFFSLFMRTVLNLPDGEGVWFGMNNSAITRFDFEAGRIQVQYLNRLDHLPKDLIT